MSGRKILGRQLSLKNSLTARAYICSDYLCLEIDDGLGGNCLSRNLAISHAPFCIATYDLREDEGFLLGL